MPEQFWDAASGKVRDKEFGEHFNQLSAFKAAEDSRKLSLPQKPEDYKTELPKDFKGPEGTPIKFKDDSPILAQAKATAQKLGLSQDGFSELLSLYVGAQLQAATDFENGRKAEIGKLGPAASGRVDAVATFANAMIGEELGKVVKDSLFTADQVKAWEAIMQKFQSQGGSTFSQQHREHSQPNGKIDGFESMSMEQRLAAIDQRNQRRTA